MTRMSKLGRVMAYQLQRGYDCTRLTARQVRRIKHKRNHANAPFGLKAGVLFGPKSTASGAAAHLR